MGAGLEGFPLATVPACCSPIHLLPVTMSHRCHSETKKSKSPRFPGAPGMWNCWNPRNQWVQIALFWDRRPVHSALCYQGAVTSSVGPPSPGLPPWADCWCSKPKYSIFWTMRVFAKFWKPHLVQGLWTHFSVLGVTAPQQGRLPSANLRYCPVVSRVLPDRQPRDLAKTAGSPSWATLVSCAKLLETQGRGIWKGAPCDVRCKGE